MLLSHGRRAAAAAAARCPLKTVTVPRPRVWQWRARTLYSTVRTRWGRRRGCGTSPCAALWQRLDHVVVDDAAAASRRCRADATGAAVSDNGDEDLGLAVSDKELLAACRVLTARSSGKGGQHVNTTDSAVRIVHLPTGVVASAGNTRCQHRNRKEALLLLRRKIALQTHSPPSAASRAAGQGAGGHGGEGNTNAASRAGPADAGTTADTGAAAAAAPRSSANDARVVVGGGGGGGGGASGNGGGEGGGPPPLSTREAATVRYLFLKNASKKDPRFFEGVKVVLRRLHAHDGALRPTVDALGTTNAKLVAFLGKDKQMLAQVNAWRAAVGSPPLPSRGQKKRARRGQRRRRQEGQGGAPRGPAPAPAPARETA